MTIADDIKLIVPHKIQGTPVLYVVRQLVDGSMEQSIRPLQGRFSINNLIVNNLIEF